MSQRAKQGVMGISWIIVGIVIISSVIIFGTVKQEDIPYTLPIDNQNVVMYTQPTQTSMPVTIETTLSPKVVMYSDLSVSEDDMTFKLAKEYQESFELFKTKVFVEKKNHGKAYKKFIADIGFIVDEEGKILDASGRKVDPALITCHVMGFFPDRPHIKPNC